MNRYFVAMAVSFFCCMPGFAESITLSKAVGVQNQIKVEGSFDSSTFVGLYLQWYDTNTSQWKVDLGFQPQVNPTTKTYTTLKSGVFVAGTYKVRTELKYVSGGMMKSTFSNEKTVTVPGLEGKPPPCCPPPCCPPPCCPPPCPECGDDQLIEFKEE